MDEKTTNNEQTTIENPNIVSDEEIVLHDSNLENGTVKKTKKRILTIISISAISIIVIVSLVIYLLLPINKFSRRINDKKYTEAFEIYSLTENNKKFVTKANEFIDKKSNQILNKYICEEIEEKDARDFFNQISKKFDVQKYNNSFISVTKSKSAFRTAEKYEKNGDIKTALDNYKKVVKKDSQNYKIAKEKTPNLKHSYCEQVLNDAQAKLDESQYYKACTILDIDVSYKTTDFINKAEAIIENANIKVAEQATKLKNEGNLSEAYKYISGFSKYANSNTQALEKDISDTYKATVITEANNLKESKKHTEAIDVLKNAKSSSGMSFENEIKEIEKARDIEYVKSVKHKLRVYHDSFSNYYIFGYAGLDPQYNWPQYRNFQMRFMATPVTGYVIVPLITMGFSRNDWIFMEKVTVKCDEKKYEFKLNWNDRNSDTSGGTIYEWFGLNPFGNPSLLSKMEEMMKSMETASKVTIRFSGDDGTYDVTLPKSHIEEAITVWKVYKIATTYNINATDNVIDLLI